MLSTAMEPCCEISFTLGHFTIASSKPDPIGIAKNKNRVVE
jgi:hypothetical protein